MKYSNTNVQQRYGNNNIRTGSQDRMDFRGRSGDQVVKPGGGGGVNLGGAANRPNVGNASPGGGLGAGNRPSPGVNRPTAGAPKRDSAMGNIQSGKVANAQSARGKASLSGGGGGGARVGGASGGARVGGGGGGARAGGGGGGGGGARRSDIRSKHDIALIGRLDNGLGFYRFSYNGSNKAYVGVMAQEVQTVMPSAVVRGPDGYLRVFYDKLGLKFETYDRWVASGAQIPSGARTLHTQMNGR